MNLTAVFFNVKKSSVSFLINKNSHENYEIIDLKPIKDPVQKCRNFLFFIFEFLGLSIIMVLNYAAVK